LVASPVLAQGDATAATRLAEYRLDDAILESVVRGVVPGISFGTEGGLAKAQYGRHSRNWSRSVSIAGPVNQREDRTTLVTEEGLNSGFNAELTVKRTNHNDSSSSLSLVSVDELCTLYERKNRSVSREDLPLEGQAACKAYNRQAKWVLATSLKAGRRRFAYSDPVTLGGAHATKSGWSLAAAGGFFPSLPPSVLYYVGFSIRRESAWRSQAATTICVPLGVTGATQCRETALGSPARTTTTLASVESRHFLGTQFAFVPRVTYAVREWMAEMPIFIRQVDKAPFNGGLNISWNSERRDIALSVFVGVLAPLEDKS
jgi:hypothetical protein